MTISATKARGLGTPFFPDRWEIIFPLIPGGTGDSSDFAARVRAGQLPGFDVESTERWFKGKRTKLITRVVEKGDITITFEEGIKLPIWKAFIAWKALEETRNPLLYKTVVVINVEDSADSLQAQITLGGVYPSDLPDVPLDHATAELVNIDISFSYDWFELTG